LSSVEQVSLGYAFWSSVAVNLSASCLGLVVVTTGHWDAGFLIPLTCMALCGVVGLVALLPRSTRRTRGGGLLGVLVSAVGFMLVLIAAFVEDFVIGGNALSYRPQVPRWGARIRVSHSHRRWSVATLDEASPSALEESSMGSTALVVLVPLVSVIAADLWVYADARSRQGTGRGPGVQIGSLQVNTPEAWATGCLVLFVIVFPMYLVARREAA
jgi:hypothetical protein